MKKLLVIPDIHGRTFWKNINYSDFDKIIFLGDFLDPYPKENITPDMARENLKEIIKFVNEYKDKVICLYGNHDLHYLSNSCVKSTRYENNPENRELLSKLPFRVAYEDTVGDKQYLFTHAGVNLVWYNEVKPIIGELSAGNLNKLITKGIEYLSHINYYIRGGYDDAGSCIWSDLRELHSVPKFSKYTQVFGHTQLKKGPFIQNNKKYEQFYCLDCRVPFVIYEYGVFKYHKTIGDKMIEDGLM